MSQANPVEFWGDNFWKKDSSPWHVSLPHPSLLKYSDIVFKQKGVRVLVPLCGKSIDLKWLYDQGCDVVGVECVTEAIEKFFAENKLEFTKEPFGVDGVRYQTNDKRLTILQCNFFKLDNEEYVNTFDVVWDRAGN